MRTLTFLVIISFLHPISPASPCVRAVTGLYGSERAICVQVGISIEVTIIRTISPGHKENVYSGNFNINENSLPFAFYVDFPVYKLYKLQNKYPGQEKRVMPHTANILAKWDKPGDGLFIFYCNNLPVLIIEFDHKLYAEKNIPLYLKNDFNFLEFIIE